MSHTHLKTVVRAVDTFSHEIVEAFSDIFQPVELDAGKNFICQGEVGKSLAFVDQGLLRSFYLSEKGEEVNKSFFMNGSFVAPLTSLVLGIPSPLYIGAMESSQLLVADYKALERLYLIYPDLNRLGRKLVEHAWIGKERRETQLIMLDARERYEAFRQDYPGLEDRLPQYQIASFLGITPVQLSRIRRDLKQN